MHHEWLQLARTHDLIVSEIAQRPAFSLALSDRQLSGQVFENRNEQALLGLTG